MNTIWAIKVIGMSRDEYNISASQIKTHASCPLQYWFRYIENQERTKKKSKYLTLGSRVHEAIERVLKEDETIPFGQPKALKSRMQNVYAVMDGYELTDEDLYDDGLKCCGKAAEYICKREPDIVGVEERVEFAINRPDMSTGVTGIMDITTDTEIWDWKTGRIRDDSEHDEKIQGAVYMAAYLNEYGREPESIKFVYVKEGTVRTVDPTDENWTYMLGFAKELLEAKRTGHFPGEPGEHCYWCAHEYWCHEAPAGAGGIEPGEY